jgi:hypothetical protein
MRKLIKPMVVLVVAAFLTTGCGDVDTSRSSVRVGYPAPGSHGAPKAPHVTTTTTMPLRQVLKAVRAAQVKGGMYAVALASRQRSVRRAPLATAVTWLPSGPSATVISSTSATTGDQVWLACTRSHESDTAGGYSAYSPEGPYYGAYQFLQSTWDTVAAHAGRPDLIGKDPRSVSPSDQDAMALHLYHWQGKGPWGGRC